MAWGRTVDIEPRYTAFLPDSKKAEKKLNSAVVLYRQHIAALRSAEGVADVQASFDAKGLARIAAKILELEQVIAEEAARRR
jgi:hypothetical protein